MNKLNNKGLTMIELIVTIALISVVMVFLYRLLANVQYDKDIEFFASKNQEQKIEIVNYMQGLLRFNTNSTFVYEVNVNTNNINFIVYNGSYDKKYQMSIQNDKTLVIKDNSSGGAGNVLRSWTIEQGTMGEPFCRAHDTKTSPIKPSLGESVSVECTIPIYTVNNNNVKDNNNTLDDIMIALLVRGK